MAKQPQAYLEFEVYEDNINLLGVAKATLSDITYLSQDMTGAGFGGTIEAVLIGMMEKMTLGLNFRSCTDAAVHLMAPKKHHIDLRVDEQYWDTVEVEQKQQADKHVMIVVPKKMSPGTVAPASVADVSGEYAVYRYEGYKDGKALWKIDPFNYVCEVGGVDYLAEMRQILGK